MDFSSAPCSVLFCLAQGRQACARHLTLPQWLRSGDGASLLCQYFPLLRLPVLKERRLIDRSLPFYSYCTHISIDRHLRPELNRQSTERPMKIEIVMDPTKAPAPSLASRVAPATTAAAGGAPARWVQPFLHTDEESTQRIFLKIVGAALGKEAKDVDVVDAVAVELTDRPSRLRIWMLRWRCDMSSFLCS